MEKDGFTMKEAQIGEDDFGMGELSDLVERVGQMAHDMAPEVEFGLEAKDVGGKIHFTFTFPTDDKVGFFLGKNMDNLRTLFEYIDSQQVYPHNKFVRIHLDKGGEMQSFEDRTFLYRFRRDSGKSNE